MNAIEHTIALPPDKIAVHRAVRRKVLRQIAPLATGTQDIHHPIHDACQSGACHRRAWPAELTVQHAPTRHPSDRSDTSGDHDCISLGSQASTSTAPGRIRPPPLNPKDSADSRSFETDTKLWLA